MLIRTRNLIPWLLLAIVAVPTAAASISSDNSFHTLCVNKKSNITTYSKSGKCPKGTESILVSAKADAPSTSYNLILRDAKGAAIKGLVSDGVVFRNGNYWALEYATGIFTPTSYLYEYYLSSSCTGEYVNPFFSTSLDGARHQFESLIKSQNSGVLFSLLTYDGRPVTPEVFSLSKNVALVDNRNIPLEGDLNSWSVRQPIFFKNSFNNDKCEESFQPWFYLTGIEKSSVLPPASLPAPIKWSER